MGIGLVEEAVLQPRTHLDHLMRSTPGRSGIDLDNVPLIMYMCIAKLITGKSYGTDTL